MKHPLQSIVRNDDGIIKFQANAIVRHLLENYPGGTDTIRNDCPAADDGDWEQLAQLVGWSVSGFGDLLYASREAVEAADTFAAAIG